MLLPVNGAVAMFSVGITAYDVSSTLVAHEWARSVGSDYVFRGKISPASDKDMDALAEGDIVSGAIVVYSIGTTLYNHDASAPTTPGAKQTFIKWNGSIWRVKQSSNRAADGGYQKYGAVKYEGGRQ